MKNIVIYKDERFYSAFPGIAKLQNGELIVGFREAPQRNLGITIPYHLHIHMDSESKAVMVRSKDNGKSWGERKVIYEEEGDVGIQDPSVTQLKDGTLIANFFSWQVIKDNPFNHYVKGTFVVCSFDNGKRWEKETAKIELPDYSIVSTSEPVLELPNGELIIPLSGSRKVKGNIRESFLMRSKDKGKNWDNFSFIARDIFGNLSFVEPTFSLLPSGKILCIMREIAKGGLYQCESLDNGNSWSIPTNLDMWGFPANLLVLKDGRVLCAYGYRRPPYGVRACLSYDKGETWDLKNEIIIRSDGFHRDLGYPSSVELKDNQILTAYYFHTGEGIRYIAGTFYKVQ